MAGLISIPYSKFENSLKNLKIARENPPKIHPTFKLGSHTRRSNELIMEIFFPKRIEPTIPVFLWETLQKTLMREQNGVGGVRFNQELRGTNNLYRNWDRVISKWETESLKICMHSHSRIMVMWYVFCQHQVLKIKKWSKSPKRACNH